MIDLVDVSVLSAACPRRHVLQLAPWLDPVKLTCAKFGIDTIRRVASFIATIGHECEFMPGREENLNYSAKRLTQVWPKRFANKAGAPNALALRLAGNPEALANVVYASRMGNGNEASGDGWRFRGIGPVQLTGRANHQAFADAMGMSLDEAEDYIRTIEGGVMSVGWFWRENGLSALADTPGVEDETRAINGGLVGLEDRRERFNRVVARLLQRERGE